MKTVTGLKFQIRIYIDEMREAVASASECPPASLPGSALVERMDLWRSSKEQGNLA